MARNLPVHIDKDYGHLAAVTVSKRQKDQLRWFSKGPKYKVVFKYGSPFDDDEFIVPTRGAVLSSPVKTAAGVGRSYKYDIVDPYTGKVLMDPLVYVED